MKLFPIVAVVAVGTFASAGYFAGSLIAGAHPVDVAAMPEAEAEAHDGLAPGTPAASSATEAEAEAILRDAEAVTDAADAEKTAPAEARKQPAAAVPGHHVVKMQSVTLPVRKRESVLLSGSIKSDLKEEFADVEDVLFLTLYKHDVGFN